MAASDSFPLKVKKPTRSTRQSGQREPNGQLSRSARATPEALAQRRAICNDVRAAENPLDAAHANGWLTDAEHRAGRSYISISRQAYDGLGGPKLSNIVLGYADPEIDLEMAGLSLTDLSDKEIAALWDRVFGEMARDPEARERNAALAMSKLRAIHAAMTADERAEVHLVCVVESWPHWFSQRRAGEAIREKAVAQKRGLTDDEQALIYKRYHTSFERKFVLLQGGLRAIQRALRPVTVVASSQGPERIESLPPPPPPERGFERTDYLDQDGQPYFVLERKRIGWSRG